MKAPDASMISLLPNVQDPQVLDALLMYRGLVRVDEKLVYVKAYKRKGPPAWYVKGKGPKPLSDEELKKIREFEKKVKTYQKHIAIALK